MHVLRVATRLTAILLRRRGAWLRGRPVWRGVRACAGTRGRRGAAACLAEQASGRPGGACGGAQKRARFSVRHFLMRNAHLPRQARDRQIRETEEAVFSAGNCRALATSLRDDPRQNACMFSSSLTFNLSTALAPECSSSAPTRVDIAARFWTPCHRTHACKAHPR